MATLEGLAEILSHGILETSKDEVLGSTMKNVGIIQDIRFRALLMIGVLADFTNMCSDSGSLASLRQPSAAFCLQHILLLCKGRTAMQVTSSTC